MPNLKGKVTFDHVDPKSSTSTDARHELAHLDYTPLPRLTNRSLCMGFLVSMGGLIFGYDTGQISGFLEMPNFQARFGDGDGAASSGHAFSDTRSGLIVGLLSIGTLCGALAGAPLADTLGRRPSISLASAVVAVGFVVQIAASTSWIQLMIGRLVAGFGVGALSLMVPMFQADTAPPWIRGSLVCAYQLFITLGIFLAACFNYGTYTHQQNNPASWRIVIGLGWLWTLILGVGVWAFSETPRFVYRKGKIDEARRTLTRVYGASENHYAIFVQMEELESKMRLEQMQPKTNPLGEMVGMFKAPRMSYRILLGIMLQMFQQLTGANYFFYYGTVSQRPMHVSAQLPMSPMKAFAAACCSFA